LTLSEAICIRAVVIAFVIFGVVVAPVLTVGRRDGFAEERGGLGMFHAEAYTSPYQMPGARGSRSDT
jgi:hypothetical protein